MILGGTHSDAEHINEINLISKQTEDGDKKQQQENTVKTKDVQQLGQQRAIVVNDSLKSPIDSRGNKGKGNSNRNLIPRPTINSLVGQQEAKEGEFLTAAQGKDLDEESTAQNFLNVARQGGLSQIGRAHV